MASAEPSRTSTPRSFTNSRLSTEDLLKSQTVGLVHLDDFRKRRAEILEQREKDAQDRTYGKVKADTSGTGTPTSHDGGSNVASELQGQPPRKKKKKTPKGPLSFDDEGDDLTSGVLSRAFKSTKSREESSPDSSSANHDVSTATLKRLAANPSSQLPAPKVLTKAALQAEAAARDALRREFLAMQGAVRNTEISIPFVFYDGTNVPGGSVKVKKGDHIWLFLERCRKVGAETGAAGRGSRVSGTKKGKRDVRRGWARVSVDDLICVRGEVIIPHHYEFYYFIANKVPSSSKSGGLLFDYSNAAVPAKSDDSNPNLRRPANTEDLEGHDTDPTLTKVVDRRWYERNKHIYPASLWKEYEPGKEFEDELAGLRRDAKGNAFFFS